MPAAHFSWWLDADATAGTATAAMPAALMATAATPAATACFLRMIPPQGLSCAAASDRPLLSRSPTRGATVAPVTSHHVPHPLPRPVVVIERKDEAMHKIV